MTKPSSVETQDELEHALHVARSAAIAGGAVLRDLFGGRFAVAKKGDLDLVTEADLESELRILDILSAAFPNDTIISEEAGRVAGSTERVWIVDPLDGTNNFVAGIPQISVSISLTQAETTLLGVVFQPLIGVCWDAVRGSGARRNNVAISCNHRQRGGRRLVAYMQGYSVDPQVETLIRSQLMGQTDRLLSNWSPATDWCLLAEGGIDGIVSIGSEQESQSAGILIAQEAGAILVDHAGRQTASYTDRMVAANEPLFLQSLLEIVLCSTESRLDMERGTHLIGRRY